MKTIKIILFSVLLGSFNNLLAQNEVWSLPPNYSINTFQNMTVIPLPTSNDYDGHPATCASNTMQDANGDLLFFIVDDEIYDKDGYLLGDLTQKVNNNEDIKGTSEIVIIPKPDNCNVYYILTAGSSNYENLHHGFNPYLATLDFNQKSTQNTNKYGRLTKCVLVQSMLPTSVPAINKQGTPHGSGNIFFAASKLRNDKSRLVFLAGSEGIYHFKVDANGFSYDDFSDYLPYIDESGTYGQRGEMELVEINNGSVAYRLALHIPYSNNDPQISGSIIYVADLDGSGNVISKMDIPITYNKNNNLEKPSIKGLEFSPNGKILYFTHIVNVLHPNAFEFYDFDNPSSGIQPVPNITPHDSEKFQFSQIELAKDGEIYLAHNGGLATLSNPNTPSSSTFTDNAIPFNYAPNYQSNPTNNPISFKSYMLPDQIDGMDYSAHFFANNACCVEHKKYDAISYAASYSTATWTPTDNPFMATSGTSGEVYVRDELIISPHSDITIKDMTFYFAPGAKVVVKRGSTGMPSPSIGGKLTLDNTTFTVDTNCDTEAMWDGIQVHGYDDVIQNPSSLNLGQGSLYISNNSKVEHALIGACAAKPDITSVVPFSANYDYAYNGGKIRGSASTFKNNYIDVMFRTFNSTNYSYFSKCDFITDGNLNIPALKPKSHVSLFGVANIKFRGNNFANLTPEEFNLTQQGYGIRAISSQFSVYPECNYIPKTDDPCTDYTSNKFSNLYTGVYAQSYSGTPTFDIDRSKFYNNYYGISVAGVNNEKITRNDFEVYRSSAPNNVITTFGIHLDASTGYIVEENTFKEYNDPGIPAGGKTYGVIVNNSGTSHNEIYKNDFQDLKIGGQSQGTNGICSHNSNNHPAGGLQWKCNTFDATIHQAALTVSTGCIDYQQGHGNNPVSNRFYNDNNSYWDLLVDSNNPNKFNYHYDVINSSTYHTKPSHYTIPQVQLVDTYETYGSGSCPSSFGGGSVGTPFEPIPLATTVDSLKQVIAQKEALINGGNTQKILDIIATKGEEEVKTKLIEIAPYLTDEVLLSYVNSQPTNSNLREVLIANSPLTDEIKSSVVQANIFTSGVKAHIISLQNGASPINQLEEKINSARSKRARLFNTLMHFYLTDTTIVEGQQKAASLLGNEADINRKRELLELQLTMKETSKAESTLNQIIAETGSDNYTNLAQIYLDLMQYPSLRKAIRNHSNITNKIEQIAYDASEPLAAAKGKALISLAYDTLFIPKVEALNIGNNNAMGAGNGKTQSQQGEKVSLFSIYPNPSDNGTEVNLELMSENNEVIKNSEIQIYSISGKLLETYRFVKNSNKLSFKTSLKSGVYLIKLFEEDILLETKKLLIK